MGRQLIKRARRPLEEKGSRIRDWQLSLWPCSGLAFEAGAGDIMVEASVDAFLISRTSQVTSKAEFGLRSWWSSHLLTRSSLGRPSSDVSPKSNGDRGAVGVGVGVAGGAQVVRLEGRDDDDAGTKRIIISA